jgi:hypothetical protein
MASQSVTERAGLVVGAAAAPAICASEGAPLGGTWRALLATSTTTAASRLNTGGATWARVDNVPLPSSAANVMSAARWNTSLNMYASGSRPGFANLPVWTGAASPTVLGTLSSPCNNWSASSGLGTGGLADDGTVSAAMGLYANTTACTTPRPVYCLQE